mgnify:FL=1
MELKVFKDTVTAYAGRWETRLELPVETEILIPDYQPAVFKIVKCLITPVILQNAVADGRWTAQGYLRCTVYYQSDEPGSRLWRMEQKLPFEKSAELPADTCAEGAAAVDGEVEYCNCRAVSEHRLDLRGAYILAVSVPTFRTGEVLTALADCGIEQRTAELQGLQRIAAEEKTFTAQTGVPLQGGETVLDVDGMFVSGSAVAGAGQLHIQGTLRVQLCCQPPDSEALTTISKELPVQQTLELAAIQDEDRVLLWGDVPACTISSDDAGETSLAVTWRLHTEVWRQQKRSVVADAYSTVCRTQTVGTVFRMLEETADLSGCTSVTVEDDLPQENMQVRGCFVTLGAAGIVPTDKGLQIEGRGTAHVLCSDERGELACYDKPFTWQAGGAFGGKPEECCLCLHAAAAHIQSSKAGARLRVELDIETTGSLLQARPMQLLTDVETGEEYPADDIALCLYYARQGEPIFDIAKRYHARAKDLAQANGMDTADTAPQELTAQAAVLLIPAAL